MPATLVDPEKILKDLRNLWLDLGRDNEVAGGVLRACGMTLVVATGLRSRHGRAAAPAGRADA